MAVSKQSLRRMPDYVRCLEELHRQGVERVAAPSLAAKLNLNEVQVRKDLASVCRSKGRPRSGFPVAELLEDMKEFLGYNNVRDAVLVGAGSIGKALLGYEGFQEYGLRIIAAFDTNPDLVGREVAGKPVYPAQSISDMCRSLRVRIGIIAVPAPHAQQVCDQLVAGGILAIWNFAPAHLNTPEGILIQNENMAASLSLLSNHLRQRLWEDTP